ncbi:hypothetical protein [Trueperella pyogenes]|uniref:hypothetical protein n=1 Tax=Trueperella pyogenes TaxID=1661 RepID=UPI0031331642
MSANDIRELENLDRIDEFDGGYVFGEWQHAVVEHSRDIRHDNRPVTRRLAGLHLKQELRGGSGEMVLELGGICSQQ